jgi:hypothetical protein
VTANPIQLNLADATLSGGARLVAAGGGLPLRITTAALQTIALGGNTNYCGIVWDVDGLHLWHSRTGVLNKYRVSDGAIVKTIACGGSCTMGLSRTDGGAEGRLIVPSYTDHTIREIDITTSAVVVTVPIGVNSCYAIRVPGVTGKYWSIPNYGTGGTFIEYNTDGTPTGRTIAGSYWNSPNVHTSFPGYFWITTYGGSTYKIRESDLAVMVTYAPTAAAYGLPCDNRSMYGPCVDLQGRLYAWQSSAQAVDRWTAAGAPDCRILWCDAARQVPWITWDAGASPNAFIRFSSDDQWMAWLAATTGGTIRFNALRALCVGVQRARWTWAFTADFPCSGIDVPGHDARAKDAVDYRASRYYYSLDGGVTRTEIVPGAPLTPIIFLTGQVLTLDGEFTMLGVPPGPAPYIGGDAGEGPRLIPPGYAHRQGFGGGFG